MTDSAVGFLHRVRRFLNARRRTRPLLALRPLQSLLRFRRSDGLVVDEALAMTSLAYDPDTDIGRSLFNFGQFEEVEIDFFTRRLSHHQSPTVLDVGANVGLHALRWADAHSRLRVFAFEPAAGTRNILSRNVRANALHARVQVIGEAVSDRVGHADFFECDDNAYSSLKDTGRKSVERVARVPVTTVDEFVNRNSLDSIDLIKIDVEGFEAEVLRGARRTLESLRPELFVEIYGGENSNADPNGTVDYLRAMGFDAFVLIDGKPAPFRRHSDQYYNYWFVHREKR